jgi:hypothetical protein
LLGNHKRSAGGDGRSDARLAQRRGERFCRRRTIDLIGGLTNIITSVHHTVNSLAILTITSY